MRGGDFLCALNPCKSTHICITRSCARTCSEGWTNRLASSLTQVAAKSRKFYLYTVDFWSTWCRFALGGQTVKNPALTCVQSWARPSHWGHCKSPSQVLARKSTQLGGQTKRKLKVESLRWLASPFGQGVRQAVKFQLIYWVLFFKLSI